MVDCVNYIQIKNKPETVGMSRSYKKTPYIGQTQDRRDKRFASKAVRRTWKIGNGGDYKRVYNSYNIRDFGWPAFLGIFGELRSYKWIRK